MLRKTLMLAALGLAIATPALAEVKGEHPEAPEGGWTFAGPFGKFDQAQLQRGFKVYQEVCSACHSLNLMSFRNLGEKHGPFYDEKYPNPNDNPYVKSIAANWVLKVKDIDTDTGDIVDRAATTADKFPSPFANEAAARASNGGALPPDLSVITRARDGGASYVYHLLTGYKPKPDGLTATETQHYNPYFPGDLESAFDPKKGKAPIGGLIAMPPPLVADKVSFDDGTKSTLDQEAKDVAAFLAWASEPKQTERKQTGLAVMTYLILLAGLVYLSYRRVWKNESHG